MAISLKSLSVSEVEAYRMLIYSLSGIGKTTLASLIPDNVFAATERGFGSKEVNFWDVETYQDMIDIIGILYNDEHNFKTLTIDTISTFETIVHDKLFKDENVTTLEGVGGGWNKWLTESLPLWHTVLDGLEALRRDRGINIILLGHAIDKQERPPDMEPYNKYTLSVLNKHVAPLIYGWVDCICFYHQHVLTKTVAGGSKKAPKKQAAKINRIMHLTEQPYAYAKNRYFDDPNKIDMTPDCSEFLSLFGFNS